MPLTPICYVVEGQADLPVVEALLRATGWPLGQGYTTNGKGQLDRDLRRYNQAARHAPWLVLRDMDNDADCAPGLVGQLLPERAPLMVCRLAVRAAEAWLMGDASAIALHLRVRTAHVPAFPEQLHNPKQALVDLARRSSSARIREQMVPMRAMSARVGPGYAGLLGAFAETTWRPDVAALSCPSLAGCLRALSDLRAICGDP